MSRSSVTAPPDGFLAGVVWWLRSLLGDLDYARYCEHLRAHHPEAEVPTEREYWRARYAEQERNPGARCC